MNKVSDLRYPLPIDETDPFELIPPDASRSLRPITTSKEDAPGQIQSRESAQLPLATVVHDEPNSSPTELPHAFEDISRAITLAPFETLVESDEFGDFGDFGGIDDFIGSTPFPPAPIDILPPTEQPLSLWEETLLERETPPSEERIPILSEFTDRLTSVLSSKVPIENKTVSKHRVGTEQVPRLPSIG